MIVHVVERGDSVWKIAQRYGVSPERIVTDNSLAGQEYLVVGQALLILIPNEIHTVKPGDTLTAVARQYGVSVLNLLQNNPSLIQAPILRPGQQLTISFTDQKLGSLSITGYAYPNIKRDVLLGTLPYLTYLTIFGYGFTSDGTLVVPEDEPLIKLAREFRVSPVMLLSSITGEGGFSGELASELFRNERLQNSVIRQVINTMRQKGYDGLDIDFEYVNQDDAEYFLAFLRNTIEKLHAADYWVNVDLAPKTSSAQSGLLYESHNYPEIGAIADTVLLMTYEWGYTYGPPMAVAPVDKVRSVVEYAVSEIPAGKIMMGIPNYGYDWPLPYYRGETRATSIGNEYAVSLAAQQNAEIQFDPAAQSPYYNYWDGSGAEHVVWFEDIRSIRAKYALIDEFGLRGGGYWNVMRPFQQNWAYLAARFHIRKV